MFTKRSNVFIWLLLFATAAAQSVTEFFPSKGKLPNFSIEVLLQQIRLEKPYESLLLLQRQLHSCLQHQQWFYTLPLPKMLLTEATTLEYQQQHNNQLLTILCLRNLSDLQLLLHAAQVLHHIRQTPLLILVEDQPPPAALNTTLSKFLSRCNQLQLLNVLLVFEDHFVATGTCHQYTPFPSFTLEQWRWQPLLTERPIYPYRFRDMQRYGLRTMADHIKPRSMHYYDAQGHLRLNGYVGRFIQAFAYKHNAQLAFPYAKPNNAMVFYRNFVFYMRNFSLDVPTSLTFVAIDDDPHECSYPLELSKWCLLLPVERYMKYKELYLYVLWSDFMAVAGILIGVHTLVLCLAILKKRNPSWLNWPSLLLNDVAVRGVLGQAFVYYVYSNKTLTLVYCSLLLSGLTVSTLLGCYLQTFLTQPPSEPRISSFDDLRKYNLKVLISQEELVALWNISSAEMMHYYSIFEVLPTYAEFSDIRDEFNRNFAYPLTSSKWHYYDGKQRFYSMQMMRYGEDMCLNEMQQLCLSLSANSIFHEPVNRLIMDVWDAGLLSYWLSKSYDDAMVAGEDNVLESEIPPSAEPLVVDDLFWIWMIYGVMIGLSILVFVAELMVHKWAKGRWI